MHRVAEVMKELDMLKIAARYNWECGRQHCPSSCNARKMRRLIHKEMTFGVHFLLVALLLDLRCVDLPSRPTQAATLGGQLLELKGKDLGGATPGVSIPVMGMASVPKH